MKALEAPEMVAAFHGANALEIPRAPGGGEGSAIDAGTSIDPTVTLHAPASPYTVMAAT